MKSVDQILKIKAVMAYILQQIPEGLDYIHLFKTMYFAQQDHLVTYGLPLMDDAFEARKHGPVPAFTYKALRGLEGKCAIDSPEMKDFAEAFALAQQQPHQVVKLSGNYTCDMDELSKSNVIILDKWISKCREMDAYDLSDLSHDSAWQAAMSMTAKTGEATRIAQYSIAEAGGAPEAMLEVIRERQLNRQALS